MLEALKAGEGLRSRRRRLMGCLPYVSPPEAVVPRAGDAVVSGFDLHSAKPTGVVGKPGLRRKLPGIDRPHPVRKRIA